MARVVTRVKASVSAWAEGHVFCLSYSKREHQIAVIRDNAPGHTYFISKEIKTKTWPKADGLTLVTTLSPSKNWEYKRKKEIGRLAGIVSCQGPADVRQLLSRRINSNSHGLAFQLFKEGSKFPDDILRNQQTVSLILTNLVASSVGFLTNLKDLVLAG